jgi:hypothetical protein
LKKGGALPNTAGALQMTGSLFSKDSMYAVDFQLHEGPGVEETDMLMDD